MSPKEWKNRKERVTYEEDFPIFGNLWNKVILYDDKGRRSEGIGKTEDEARDKAHKKWDLKYR